jgi:dTDP-4-amino-4,6-dideoxygalactose transaminase
VESAELSPSAARYAQALADECRIVVLVDLFGVPAPVEELLALNRDSAGWLVHDRAQSLIDLRLEPGSRVDAVITSLGRGKPVSLLGGGAVWCRAEADFLRFARSTYRVAGWNETYAMTKAAVYNLALQPIIYGIAAGMPGLGVGETRLVPLRKVERLPETWLQAAACQSALASSTEPIRRDRSATLVEIALQTAHEVPTSVQESVRRIGLNRLPILCRTAELAMSLREKGRQLGLSPMYGRTLPEFLGLSEQEVARVFPHAYDLSRRLVTLPTHSRISAGDLTLIRRILDACR